MLYFHLEHLKRKLAWSHIVFWYNKQQILNITKKTSSSVQKNLDQWQAFDGVVTLDVSIFKSSCSQMFCKIGALKL